KTSKDCEGELLKKLNLLGLVQAYPNPTSNTTTIYLPIKQSEVIIEIYDSMGLLISKKKYPVVDANVSLDIENLDAGMYITRIQLEETKTLKIIKR
ncbi:MAG: T9SS type A sorting domain-containing protein, partial [Flavicella sp.]